MLWIGIRGQQSGYKYKGPLSRILDDGRAPVTDNFFARPLRRLSLTSTCRCTTLIALTHSIAQAAHNRFLAPTSISTPNRNELRAHLPFLPIRTYLTLIFGAGGDLCIFREMIRLAFERVQVRIHCPVSNHIPLHLNSVGITERRRKNCVYPSQQK